MQGGDKAPVADAAKARTRLMPDSHTPRVNTDRAAHCRLTGFRVSLGRRRPELQCKAEKISARTEPYHRAGIPMPGPTSVPGHHLNAESNQNERDQRDQGRSGPNDDWYVFCAIWSFRTGRPSIS